ncbi:MAG TPA: bifunctional UDP-sugar hydrolase/5'-nucleotidase [Polyangiaceae bacterium]|jgi:5'-nucleotidase
MARRCGLPGFLRLRFAALALGASAAALAATEPGCTSGATGPSQVCPPGETCDVRLTLLHTADIHSRIFPYDLQILQVDSQLGLGTLDEVKNVGGVARVSYVVNRERARADRVLHVDSGDIFEGAPVFNYFDGEPEARASSMMGTDVMVIGNHEFDDGAINAVRQMQKWADFPLLAANYAFPAAGTAKDPGLDTILKPFMLFNLEGLRVGVIGMANFSSLGSVFQQPNSLGIMPLNTIETAQGYVDLLRPMVDVVVVLSHLGLDVDERMVQGTTGIDVVEGGHNHIVINPPQTIQDCTADPSSPGYVWAVNPNIPFDPSHPVYDPADTLHQHPNSFRRFCTPRNVLISHSGAFSKYVGRLDLMLSNDPKRASPTGNPDDYDPTNGFEIVSSTYVPYPIDDTVPDDPNIDNLLLPYERYLDQTVDLELLAGFSPQGASRTAPQGGDSPMGNLISDSMWLRLGVQTDFAMTNTTGIRTDMIPGPVTIEEMFNIFPFNNTITKMQLSGTEVQNMFDFIAGRSQSRGCVSQAQIAGSRVILNCSGCSRGGANANCDSDDQCIGGVPGSCIDGSGNDCLPGEQCTCDVSACAEQIYIGYLSNCGPGNPNCVCTADKDCPDNLQGQCDTSASQGSGGSCLAPLVLTNVYDFATSNYLAAGGSGFKVLQDNTTQLNTYIEQRDAVIDFIRNAPPCGYSTSYGTNEGLMACSTDADCQGAQGPGADFVCACPGQVNATGTTTSQTCITSGSCDPNVGRCVRQDCRDDVATFHETACQSSPNTSQCNTDLDACSLAGEECKLLSCVDESLGALTDNRVEMIGR